MTELEEKIDSLTNVNICNYSDNETGEELNFKREESGLINDNKIRNYSNGLENDLTISSKLKNYWYAIEFSSKFNQNPKLTIQLFNQDYTLSKY